MFFKNITVEIEELIGELSAPLTPAETRSGWRQEIKESTQQYFEDILERVRSKEALPALDIVRSLDHSGVIGGLLLHKVAKIVNKLRSGKQG